MSDEDREYFERRASEEHALAERCSDATVASAHRRMAEEYERRLSEVTARRIQA